MAPYDSVYNLDKAQVLKPGRFNDGPRLREFRASLCGTLLALAALLAHDNEYGDIHSGHEIIGTWAGDRMAIMGDDSDISSFAEDLARFTDISEPIWQALCEDDTLRTRLLRDREVEPPQPQPLAFLKGRSGRGRLQ
jgi:hypothetical protein